MRTSTKRQPTKRGLSSTGRTDLVKGARADVPAEAPAEDSRPDWLDGLSPLEERFSAEFIAHGSSGADAVMAVWPQTASRNAARVRAHTLLSKPAIRARIKALHEEIQAELQFTAKKVYLEIARIARADPRRLYYAADDAAVLAGEAKAGDLKRISELDDDTVACISGLEVEEDWMATAEGDRVQTGQTKKIKLRDRLAALKALGDSLGMFEAKKGAVVPTMIVNIKI